MINGWVWTLGTIELTLSALFVTAFVFLYFFSRPWWKSEVGRQVMISNITFAVVLWVATISSLYVHYGKLLPDWWIWVRVASFGLVPVGFAWLLLILIRRLWETRRAHRDREG